MRSSVRSHLQALGDVILDEEARFADGGALRIRIGGDAPGSAHGAGQDQDRQRASTETLVFHHGAAVFDAVGRRTTRVSGTPAMAAPFPSRRSAVANTVSPVR